MTTIDFDHFSLGCCLARVEAEVFVNPAVSAELGIDRALSNLDGAERVYGLGAMHISGSATPGYAPQPGKVNRNLVGAVVCCDSLPSGPDRSRCADPFNGRIMGRCATVGSRSCSCGCRWSRSTGQVRKHSGSFILPCGRISASESGARRR